MAEELGDVADRAFVVDFELSCCTGAACSILLFNLDASTFDGEVKIIVARSSVSAGGGVGTCRNVGDAKWEEGVAKTRGFAG